MLFCMLLYSFYKIFFSFTINIIFTVSFVQYIYYQSVYSHILLIFSFCNIDDVCWGTKNLVDSNSKKGYYEEKIIFIAKWLVSNIIFSFILIYVNDYFGYKGYLLVGIAIYTSFILGSKLVFAILNHFHFYIIDTIKYWR